MSALQTEAEHSGQAALARLRACGRAQGPLTYRQRMKGLSALGKAVRRRREAICAAIDADFGGRSRHETLSAEIYTTLESIRHTRAHLREWMEVSPREVSMTLWPSRAQVIHQPLGVVGIISPWNYPLYLALTPLVAATAAGNRALLKPSEHTPRTSALLAEILSASLGDDVVAVVQGDHQVGEAFSRLPLDHLLFTGSTAVGRHIMAAASSSLTPVTLELGGKSPALILPGGSLKRAARSIINGKLLNAGQTCIAPDYVLCPSAGVEPLAAALQTEVRRRFPSLKDNPDYTAIINDRHRLRLQGLLDDAQARGARLVPINPADEDLADSPRMVPTLVLDPTAEMAVMKEEIFGPVLPIVSYETLDEAIAYVDARPRPLALYCFGSRRQARKVLHSTVSGGVTLNDTLMHVTQETLPFGGVGASGMGAYHGYAGFETFSHRKSVLRQSRFALAPRLIRPPYGRLVSLLLRLLIR